MIAKIILTFSIFSLEALGKQIKEPVILDYNNGVWIHGQALNISCIVYGSDNVTQEWVTPNPFSARKEESISKKKLNDSIEYTYNLQIKELTYNDEGSYMCLVTTSDYKKKTIEHYINIYNGKPIVYMEYLEILVFNQNATISCEVMAYPKPKIYWTARRCTYQTCSVEQMSGFEIVINKYKTTSVLTIASNSSIHLSCHANNLHGNSTVTTYAVVGDFGEFRIWSPNITMLNNEVAEAAIGEHISLYCGVIYSRRFKGFEWEYSNKDTSYSYSRMNKNDVYNVRRGKFIISYIYLQRAFHMRTNYKCIGMRSYGVYTLHSVARLHLDFKEPSPPRITETNLHNKVFHVNLHTRVELVCSSDGFPKPTVTWLKNNKTLWLTKNDNKIMTTDSNLTFLNIKAEDEAVYTCKIENINGTIVKSMALVVNFKNKWVGYYYATGIVVLILAGCIVIYIIKKNFCEKKETQTIMHELEEIRVNTVEKNHEEDLHSSFPIKDLFETEFISYHISRKQIKLGEKLGEGEFGIAIKAEVEGCDGNDSKTVAVKMVKNKFDVNHLQTLSAEVKVMVHIGHHLNVVNLLGFCPNDTGKLLVILEYCRFGNVHDFLKKHKYSFVDQVDPSTKKVDFSIKFKQSTSDDSLNTNETEVNHLKIEKNISTKDLTYWSYQIAKGMEYLASREIIHCDLAARNVLLAENNIVKITDFGLAKHIHKTDIYQRKRNGPVPLRWMAIESIQNGRYSVQSDVWSFGITLWELFSLSCIPYPGLSTEEVTQMVPNGYRMNIPEYGFDEIYSIMLNCWRENPYNRPSFTELADVFGRFLKDNEKENYVEFNDPYVKMNQKMEEDYIKMTCPAEIIKIASRHPYANQPVIGSTDTNETSTSSYKKLRNIFHPFSPPGRSKKKNVIIDFNKIEPIPEHENESDFENTSLRVSDSSSDREIIVTRL